MKREGLGVKTLRFTHHVSRFWEHYFLGAAYGSVYATVAAGVKRGVWIGSEEGLFYSDGQAIEQYLFDAQRLVPLQIDPEKIHFDTLRLRGILGNLGS